MDKIRRDKRKEVHARLDFEESPKKSRRVREGSQNSSVGTLPARYRNPSKRPKMRDRLRYIDRNMFDRLGHRRQSVFDRHSDTYSPSTTNSGPNRANSRDRSHSRGRPRKRVSSPRRDRPRSKDLIRDIEESYESGTSDRGHWKSNSKRRKPTSEEDLVVPGHVKRWINSCLESAISKFCGKHECLTMYKPMTEQQKKYVKDPVEIHNIKQRDGETIEDFIDRAGALERLVAAFFSDNPMYDATRFRKTYRMARPLFNRIVTALNNYDPFFHNNIDSTRREDISPLIKCTSAIRQLAYGVNEKHEFSRMLGSLNCTDWEWFGCPYAFKEQYVRCDHGSNPFILLKAAASQDLWIWHAFFGVAGLSNDVNVLYQSPLFNDLKTDRAPKILFVANGVSYPSRYYLVDEIYPELTPLVKTIPEPPDVDHKRILYKQKQESAKKNVERVFGVLKKK
nr:hypothetical protein [Tanacetum cinerariifolium]